MIILTAGHTGPNTGAQCATTQFDEGSETIWLRNRVAEILTNKYGLVVLMDDDTASLKLLLKDLQHPNVGTQRVASYRSPDRKSDTPNEQNQHNERANARQDAARCVPTSEDFVIDLHFNAHTNPNARGTETIVSDDATELELRMASRLAHTTSDALDIPLRCIKSESQTPHRRLAMLHLTPQSIILEVCFCTSPEDVEAYRKHRRKIASTIAKTIAELILDRKT